MGTHAHGFRPMHMRQLNVKFRFAIAMSIGALALVAGMGAITMRFAKDDLLATLSAQQLAATARTAEDIDGKLRFALDSLAAVAAVMPQDALATPAAFATFQRTHPMLLKLFDVVILVDHEGVAVGIGPDDRYGILGTRNADQPYIRRVFARGQPTISEPFRGRASRLPVVNLAVPIFDAEGRARWVMVGALSLDRPNFLGSMSSTKVGNSGYLIAASTGAQPKLVAHPDRSRLLEDLSTDRSSVIRTLVSASHPGVGVDTLGDGSEALVSYQPLRMTNWVLASVLPRAEAFALIDQAQQRIVDMAVFTALVALPLTWLVAWFLLRPLTRLHAELEIIATDRDHHGMAHIGGNDEVGKVASAFNTILQGQRASEALRLASDQDRRRLVAILESSQDFVAMADVDGELTYLNASARKSCGIDLDHELSRLDLARCLPPWALARLLEKAIPAALEHGVWVGETAILDAAGHEIPVDQTVIAHRNVDGKLEFFSSLLHDTSAAQAAAALLRSSESRMLSIADALPVMVSYIDRDFRYRFVNSRYEEHFGVDKSALIGRSVTETIGETAFRIYQPFFERAAAGESQVFEIESHSGTRPAHFLVKLLPQFDDVDQVSGFHFIHQDVTDHKVENQRLSQLARADALTGLLNRAGFESAIGEAMARSASHLTVMALFYLDVDRFKSINDVHGHQIGDKLLRGFASRLVRAVRSADVAARLGGDEFVVIAEGLRTTDDVRSIAAKILAAMRPPFELNGATLSITASIGVAVYTGEAMRADELIGRADAALYRAKDRGRDRYELDERIEDFGSTSLIGMPREAAADCSDAGSASITWSDSL